MTITTKWLGTPFPFFQSGTPLPIPPVVVGAAPDMQARLISQIPNGWTAINAPVLKIILGGISDALAWAYGLLQYVKAQTRLLTSTGFMLDLRGYDFLGRRIRRRPFQTDRSFRTTIQKEIFRERNTRKGIQQAVFDLTGPGVSIFEPKNPQDSGGWGINFAFNTAGAWGSSTLAYALFLTCPQPSGTGIPSLSGLNDSFGGFGAGAFGFADLTTITGLVTDADIYAAIEGTRPAGVTCWVNIGSPAPWAQTIAAAPQLAAAAPSTISGRLLLLGP